MSNKSSHHSTYLIIMSSLNKMDKVHTYRGGHADPFTCQRISSLKLLNRF